MWQLKHDIKKFAYKKKDREKEADYVKRRRGKRITETETQDREKKAGACSSADEERTFVWLPCDCFGGCNYVLEVDFSEEKSKSG